MIQLVGCAVTCRGLNPNLLIIRERPCERLACLNPPVTFDCELPPLARCFGLDEPLTISCHPSCVHQFWLSILGIVFILLLLAGIVRREVRHSSCPK